MNNIILLLAGLGLFLYGMGTMSEGLEGAASSKMKKIVELFTKNPLIGICVGTFVTAIIQSSSATTVMVVGFVNAGVMNLSQAISIIMGANIGTTVTAQMVSFKLDMLAPYAIILGVFVMMITKKPIVKRYAQISLGFGLLFMGMTQMSESMEYINEIPQVKNLIVSLNTPSTLNSLMLLILGLLFTGVIQSSSATTVLLVTMVGSGTITVETAFPMLLGANIGTTVTALISSIGASKSALKAAIFHLLFNTIGAMLFMLMFLTFRSKAVYLMEIIGENAERRVANIHTIFNIISTCVMYPFINSIVKFINAILPENDEKSKKEHGGLDLRMLKAPSVALQATKIEILSMGEKVIESYGYAVEGFIKRDKALADRTFEIEKNINNMEIYLDDYLIKLSNVNSFTDDEYAFIDNMFNLLNDFERIGDHADNIAEMTYKTVDEELIYSEEAIKEFSYMSERVMKSLKESVKCLADEDKELAESIIKREDKIDKLEKEYRRQHIKRLNSGECKVDAGVIFVDILSNLERIADHTENIAMYVSNLNYNKVRW